MKNNFWQNWRIQPCLRWGENFTEVRKLRFSLVAAHIQKNYQNFELFPDWKVPAAFTKISISSGWQWSRYILRRFHQAERGFPVKRAIKIFWKEFLIQIRCFGSFFKILTKFIQFVNLIWIEVVKVHFSETLSRCRRFSSQKSNWKFF